MTAGPESLVVELQGVDKRYSARSPAVLQSLDFQMHSGEAVALTGRSGSGKTTLLNLLAGLDLADGGRVCVCGQDLGPLGDAGRTRLRREKLGVVYQAFNLLPTLTAGENLRFPLALLGRDPAPDQLKELLDALGLDGLADRFPWQMSGGEQQRLAVGRAMVHGPELILADEPTGNLDLENAHAVIDLLIGQCRRTGTALLLITHSADLSERLDRTVHIEGGHLRSAG